MAKKKKLKLSKNQRKQLFAVGIPVLVGLFGLLIGITGTRLLSGRRAPKNLVWAADKTIKIPKDLRTLLLSQDQCKGYNGTDTPTGVGLWGVYQVSKASYAKIAYGCSWNLSSYIMAIKQNGQWQLIKPKDYFSPFQDGVDPTKGALPYCAVVDKYKIPKDIEPFCIQADGSAKANETP